MMPIMPSSAPDLDAFEKAPNAVMEPQKLQDTMAFVSESRYISPAMRIKNS